MMRAVLIFLLLITTAAAASISCMALVDPESVLDLPPSVCGNSTHPCKSIENGLNSVDIVFGCSNATISVVPRESTPIVEDFVFSSNKSVLQIVSSNPGTRFRVRYQSNITIAMEPGVAFVLSDVEFRDETRSNWTDPIFAIQDGGSFVLENALFQSLEYDSIPAISAQDISSISLQDCHFDGITSTICDSWITSTMISILYTSAYGIGSSSSNNSKTVEMKSSSVSSIRPFYTHQTGAIFKIDDRSAFSKIDLLLEDIIVDDFIPTWHCQGDTYLAFLEVDNLGDQGSSLVSRGVEMDHLVQSMFFGCDVTINSTVSPTSSSTVPLKIDISNIASTYQTGHVFQFDIYGGDNTSSLFPNDTIMLDINISNVHEHSIFPTTLDKKWMFPQFLHIRMNFLGKASLHVDNFVGSGYEPNYSWMNVTTMIDGVDPSATLALYGSPGVVLDIDLSDSSFSYQRSAVVRFEPWAATDASYSGQHLIQPNENQFLGCPSINISNVLVRYFTSDSDSVFSIRWDCMDVGMNNVTIDGFMGNHLSGPIAILVDAVRTNTAVGVSSDVNLDVLRVGNFIAYGYNGRVDNLNPVIVFASSVETDSFFTISLTNSVFFNFSEAPFYQAGILAVDTRTLDCNSSNCRIDVHNVSISDTSSLNNGAIFVNVFSPVSIFVSNCSFERCTTSRGAGGAITLRGKFIGLPTNFEIVSYDYPRDPFISIRDSVFVGNTALEGGAVYVSSDWFGGEIIGNNFSNNTANNVGGALFYRISSFAMDTRIMNNTFEENAADYLYTTQMFLELHGAHSTSTWLSNNDFQSKLGSIFIADLGTGGGGNFHWESNRASCPPGSVLSNKFGENLSFWVAYCTQCTTGSYFLDSSETSFLGASGGGGGNTDQCIPCPENGNCEEGHVSPSTGTFLNEYYNSFRQKVASIHDCPASYCCESEDRCSKTLDDQCQNNHAGMLCGDCKNGYSPAMNADCVKDEDCSVGAFLGLTICFSILSTLFLFLSPSSSAFFKISAFFFQILPIVSFSTVESKTVFPDFFVDFLATLSSLASFEVAIGNGGGICPWAGISRSGTFALQLLGPFLSVVVLTFLWCCCLQSLPISLVWQIVKNAFCSLRVVMFGDKSRWVELMLWKIRSIADNDSDSNDDNDEGELKELKDVDALDDDEEDDEEADNEEESIDKEESDNTEPQLKLLVSRISGDNNPFPLVPKHSQILPPTLQGVATSKLLKSPSSIFVFIFPPLQFINWHWFLTRRFVMSIVALILLSYRNTVAVLLRLTFCADVVKENGDRQRVLFEAGSEQCGTQQIFIWLFIVFVLFPFPLAIQMYRITVRFWHHSLLKSVSYKHGIVIGVLEDAYRRGFQYWESVMLYERLLLLMFYVLISNNYARSMTIIIFLLIFLFVDLIGRPFATRMSQALSSFSLLCLVLLALTHLRAMTLLSEGQPISDGVVQVGVTLQLLFVSFFIVAVVSFSIWGYVLRLFKFLYHRLFVFAISGLQKIWTMSSNTD